MLVYLRAAFVIVLLSCLASAYSTLFLTEGVGEEGKAPMAEVTKIQKMEKNLPTEKLTKDLGIEVEVIPIVTDVFTQAEDLFNMTPLKLVAAISAQNLLTTVKNIPIAGNSYKDSLAMLEGVVDEFNKTAQIIKLTAKYVNISGHYILSILKEFSEQSCEVKSLDENLKSVRKNFLKTITEHTVATIKELNEKTRDRELTGSDILVSSSYHIVSAFQEMINQVLSVAAESKKKCKEQKSQNILTFQSIPQQVKTHQSIKKDQAQAKTNEEDTQTTVKLSKDQGLQNFNNDDLTVEIYSPKTLLNTNNNRLPNKKDKLNHLKVTEDMPIKYIPLQKISLFRNPKPGILTEVSKEKLVDQNTFSTEKHSQDPPLKSSNDQDLRVEVFSPDTISKTNNAQLLNHKNLENGIKLPTELNVKYIPLEKISLLQNSKSGILTKPNRIDFTNQKPSTNFENSENQTPKHFNNQDLKVNIFPLERIQANSAEISQKNIEETPFEIPDDITVEYPPHNKLSLLNPKNGLPTESFKEDQAHLKMSTKSNDNDRELDSAAVDSLSNVPWSSNESKEKGFSKYLLMKPTTEKQLTPKVEMNIVDLLKSQHQNEQKQKHCDENLEPVCCFDENNKKFIIFLNDCKREEHNRLHQSRFSPMKMDTCVGLFLRNPTLFAHLPIGSHSAPTKNIDLKPR